jgi:hypothetical protein
MDIIMPPTRSPLPISGVSYVTCSRTTHSDVMVTTNTTRRFDATAAGKPSIKNAELRRIQCVLPYDETMGNFSSLPDPSPETTTLLQTSLGKQSRAKTSEMMQEEQRQFMQRLRRERQERTAMEHDSATRIQASYRGFTTRPHTDTVVTIKVDHTRRQEQAKSHGSLVTELHALAKRAGLQPIEGATLIPKKKVTKKDRILIQRMKQQEELAATKLQSLARKRHGLAAAEERKEFKDEEAKVEAARLIQRCSRGLEGRRNVRKEKEAMAAQIVQTRYRKMLGRSKMSELRNEKQQGQREEHAATTLQNLARRRLHAATPDPLAATSDAKAPARAAPDTR